MESIKQFPFPSIVGWYTKNGRHDLPWRQIYHLPEKDRHYKVWIAEVMLQQTQVDRVVSYYKRFLEKYPTIESLASTTYEELFPYWQGLGYYSRARRMIELAKIVVEKYDGIFPEDFETLRKLPGVGTYTAQALLGFGYDQPILALDANLQKIFARYYFGTRFKRKKKEERRNNKAGIDDFDTLIPQLQKQVQKEKISGRDINNALMDFGTLVSTTFDKVDKDVYPLPKCEWFQTEGKLEVKEKIHVTPAKAGVHPEKKSVDSCLRRNDGKKYICLVFLHENHTKYWSSAKSHYEPFLIEPIGKDDRKSIQDYFSATFGLEVSVRPSFGNAQLTPGLGIENPGVEQAAKLFHAQIQTGKLSFFSFPKKEKNDWIKKFLSISEDVHTPFPRQ